jgi:hypothetical protein
MCCRCGCPPAACTCCELVCFERPNYHCGHLLTDADLSLQVKYVVEKNKLRNRALHGHGVVCGLKITCDPHCHGHIIVHDGYAIDDCGNDIIVCEKQRFDVLAALRAKKLIWHEHRHDLCEPRIGEECRIKECFYVTICYDEEDCEFETPFRAGCMSGPQDCVPTRTKEGFRLDVTDRLPEERTYIEWLEKRLKHCFRLFQESAVGRLMKKEMTQIREIIDLRKDHEWGEEEYRERRRCHCELFRMLKGHFIEQMKLCPDELDCCLLREVECLCCPERDCDDYECEIRKRFCCLFELMLHYQYDCVMSELVFGCAEPEKACCVVLGTVEIVDGRLCRVCNIPRRHVWTFANLLPLAISTILTGSFSGTRAANSDKDECERPHRFECCPDYGPFDCEAFLCEFETDVSGRYMAATAILRAASEAFDSLTKGFAFTRSDAVAADFLTNKSMEDVAKFAECFGLHYSEPTRVVESPRFDPFQAFLSQILLRRGDSVKFHLDEEEKKVRYVVRDRKPGRSYEHGEAGEREIDGSPAERDEGGGRSVEIGEPKYDERIEREISEGGPVPTEEETQPSPTERPGHPRRTGRRPPTKTPQRK